MKRIFISMLTVSAIVLASCSSDENTKDEIVTPTTYTFLREGATSVSFSGQTTRIAMAEELTTALKESSNTEAALKAMFAHVEGDADFSDAALNASSKSIRSKVAASTDLFSANTTDATAIKEAFDAWISEQVTAVFPNYEVFAEAGVAGQLQESGGGSTRYINGKGVELNQILAKGLIGGLMTDQILNNYLGTAVLDGDSNINVQDNDTDTLADGENYTNMEHKWDEAYGYLYGAETDAAIPTYGTDGEGADSFLNKYLTRVEADSDFAGITGDIYNAFKLGRAAIVAKDYNLRNEQAAIIRAKISEVIGVRAVYYLQVGKGLLTTDKAAAFHDLSEGLGFVYSLQFTRQPNATVSYFTKTEVDSYLSDLLDTGNGLWEATTADKLDEISEKIAAKFSFTVAEAAN